MQTEGGGKMPPVADREEILHFYTGVMRGKIHSGGKAAAIADRLRAAAALERAQEEGRRTDEALEKLDRLLEEMGRAADRKAE